MDDAQAIAVLTALLQERDLTAVQRAAILHAIGIFAWTKFIPGRLESIKQSRERSRGDDGAILDA